MDENRKKLIQLRTQFEFYKKLKKKIERVMNAELELEQWQEEVHEKVDKIEAELDDLKMEMDLPDSEWDEDENDVVEQPCSHPMNERVRTHRGYHCNNCGKRF